MKEQSVKRHRKTKKIMFNSKKEFVRVYSFMTSEPPLPPLPLLKFQDGNTYTGAEKDPVRKTPLM